MNAPGAAAAGARPPAWLAALRRWWLERRVRVLSAALVVLAAFAALKLGSEFARLLWGASPLGAVDLRLRHAEVQRWFARLPVYAARRSAIYPPATYPLLWPFLGWLNLTPARWLWAVSSVVMLAWLDWIVVRESGAQAGIERAFVALLPLAMNATGVAIGNGQLTVHCLAVLVAGVLLVERGRGGWRADALGALLILVALVKPSIAAFFFWTVLCRPRRPRPALLVGVGYLALTLLAAAFQAGGLPASIAGWLHNAAALGGRQGYDNAATWCADLGIESWSIPISLLVLGVCGMWTRARRGADIWVVLGVIAIVARVGIYHSVYDDMLILLPMVALFRVAKSAARAGDDVLAGILLAVLIAVMLAPARMQFSDSPWLPLFATGHAVVWALVLLFLLSQARRSEAM